MTGRFVEFRQEEIHQSISARFEQQVLLNPNRTAIRTRQTELTYAELNRIANGIARLISSREASGGGPVALILDQGALSIAAILGVLKAGRPYVPLDPSFASDRLAFMREDSCSELILTDQKNFSTARGLAGNVPVVRVDDAALSPVLENPGLPVSPDSTAYILYTSGSTGQPKGIYQNHRNVLHNIMKYTNGLKISSGDRLTLLYSCSFGASVSDIFGALLNGASLFPFNLKEEGLHQLAEWLLKEEITIYHSVPTVFRHFVSGLKENKNFLKLRMIKLGGEPVFKRDWDLYRKHFHQGCVFHVGLGSTEMNIVRQYFCDHQTAPGGPIVPVGYEVQDTEILLLDEKGGDAGFDREGEIAIRSSYLPPGYWRRPDLTAAAFLPDPGGESRRIYRTGDRGRMSRDGCLTVLGRTDSQLKIRGYRVEPAEVETALGEIDGVREAAVVGLENRRGDKRLVAYVVPQEGATWTLSELRASLVRRLPEYMVPADIVPMEALPLTPSGKIDRKRLPPPERKRPELKTVFVAPRDEFEARVIKICEEVLDLHPIGIKDDLKDLGTDSIQYLNLVLEIEQQCGRSLPLDRFPRVITVEDLTLIFRSEERPPVFTESDENSTPAGHASRKRKKTTARSALVAASAAMAPVVSYGAGVKFLSWFCAQEWAQRKYFRKQLTHLRQVLAIVNSSRKESDAVRTNLLCNVFRHWIYGALARCSSGEFDRWVTVSGMPIVQRSHQKTRGVVVLLSHMALEHLTRLILHRNGFGDILILAERNKPEVPRLLGLERSGQLVLGLTGDDRFFIRQVGMAKKVLDRGGMVCIAGDGRHGGSGFQLPFHGRLYGFKAGFAELAVKTGADVIPVFVSMDIAGQIGVTFLEPLNGDLPETGHGEKVEGLVRSYAGLLEKRWTDDPGNIRSGEFNHFLALPEVQK